MSFKKLVERFELEPEPEPEATGDEFPQFVSKDGEWQVRIVDADERQGHKGLWLRVIFQLDRGKRKYIWMAKLRPRFGGKLEFASPPDAQILPLLEAGRGRLKTKCITASSGGVFVHHKWSVE